MPLLNAIETKQKKKTKTLMHCRNPKAPISQCNVLKNNESFYNLCWENGFAVFQNENS